MKTYLMITALVLGMVPMLTGKPINYIYSLREPLEEESYIDDIPFDTWQIAVATIIGGDEIQLPEEPYVDDIPFDTRTVAGQCLLQSMHRELSEPPVNDIPFNTEKVVCEHKTARMTEAYRNEPGTRDLPGMTFFLYAFLVK